MGMFASLNSNVLFAPSSTCLFLLRKAERAIRHAQVEGGGGGGKPKWETRRGPYVMLQVMCCVCVGKPAGR